MRADREFHDEDASHRTELANERTFLAWWRSGLAALAVSLAVGRVVPELGHQTRWPYAVLGALYGLAGIGMIAYGTLRQREVEQGIQRGVFVSPKRPLLSLFTVLVLLVGIGTVVLVLVQT